MEKELNIAAILKEKPKGTKLWSPVFGECKLLYITDFAEPIQLTTKSNETYCFRKDGRYVREGEIMLFPSKEMRSWDKFTWKKGDVLQISDIGFCTFEKWTSDNYTTFKGRNGVGLGKNFNHDYISKEDLTTSMWYKVENKGLIKDYLDTVEKRLGGKLNLDTLEIEKQPEFKEGDIVVAEGDNLEKKIFIFRYKMRDSYSDERIYKSHITINPDGSLFHKLMFYLREDVTYRLATDSEKQQLFLALEKEGKRWNPDTKQIEDLPKKCELKPFDKVLVRNNDAETWIPILFGFYDKEFENYVCMGEPFDNCIPYNEETKHLLGTTDEWKGDEV